EEGCQKRGGSVAPPAKVASSNAIFHPRQRRSGVVPSPSIRQRGQQSRAATQITHIKLGVTRGPIPASPGRPRAPLRKSAHSRCSGRGERFAERVGWNI